MEKDKLIRPQFCTCCDNSAVQMCKSVIYQDHFQSKINLELIKLWAHKMLWNGCLVHVAEILKALLHLWKFESARLLFRIYISLSNSVSNFAAGPQAKFQSNTEMLLYNTVVSNFEVLQFEFSLISGPYLTFWLVTEQNVHWIFQGTEYFNENTHPPC